MGIYTDKNPLLYRVLRQLNFDANNKVSQVIELRNVSCSLSLFLSRFTDLSARQRANGGTQLSQSSSAKESTMKWRTREAADN